MNIFVFDIETIPDTKAGRRLYHLSDLDDTHVADAMHAMQREKNGRSFLPLYLQKIVAISVVFHHANTMRVWSLGDKDASEAELLRRFFHGIEKYTPTLVSWNGGGFDLPVIHYRALLHGVQAPDYWEMGDAKSEFRWNNYLNRYHFRHIDLMDVLANYQMRAAAPLQDIAVMLGFPGKMGMQGDKVWEYYQSGKLEDIRNYCETDVLNTYLVYLRFELMRGKLSIEDYETHTLLLKNSLDDKPHLQEFINAWTHL